MGIDFILQKDDFYTIKHDTVQARYHLLAFFQLHLESRLCDRDDDFDLHSIRYMFDLQNDSQPQQFALQLSQTLSGELDISMVL